MSNQEGFFEEEDDEHLRLFSQMLAGLGGGLFGAQQQFPGGGSPFFQSGSFGGPPMMGDLGTGMGSIAMGRLYPPSRTHLGLFPFGPSPQLINPEQQALEASKRETESLEDQMLA